VQHKLGVYECAEYVCIIVMGLRAQLRQVPVRPPSTHASLANGYGRLMGLEVQHKLGVYDRAEYVCNIGKGLHACAVHMRFW
jgi:hypothetical protein